MKLASQIWVSYERSTPTMLQLSKLSKLSCFKLQEPDDSDGYGTETAYVSKRLSFLYGVPARPNELTFLHFCSIFKHSTVTMPSTAPTCNHWYVWIKVLSFLVWTCKWVFTKAWWTPQCLKQFTTLFVFTAYQDCPICLMLDVFCGVLSIQVSACLIISLC